jgi:hypothetical protein
MTRNTTTITKLAGNEGMRAAVGPLRYNCRHKRSLSNEAGIVKDVSVMEYFTGSVIAE